MTIMTALVTTIEPTSMIYSKDDVASNVFYDANAIYDAGTKAMKGSKFKYKTQLYESNHLLYTAKLRQSVIDGTYEPKPSEKFPLRERGKLRYIASNSMEDKTINHVISDEILIPTAQKYLIHDNGASQKGKGVSFHRRRFEQHLHEYYNRYGTNEGYILLVDFSGYYANIPHEKCRMVLNYLLDHSRATPEEREIVDFLLDKMFMTFRMDVSRFSDEEIATLREGKLDPMLNIDVDPKLLTGRKFLDKGVDIGNQNSQCIGIAYPFLLDNYVKIVCGVRGYGRYTDDFYVIHPDKRFLHEVLVGVKEIADILGLIINDRKTRIVKLSGFYRHLQNGYSLTDTGKLICKINPKGIVRERRKLKAYHHLYLEKVMSYVDVENAFKGWLGDNYKRMSHWQIWNLTGLYRNLFHKLPFWKKGHGRLHWLMTHKPKD